MKRRGIFRWAAGVSTVIAVLATAAVALATVSALTINSKGTVSPGGFFATVGGTITCPQGDNWDLDFAVRQSTGAKAAIATGFTSVGTCSGGADPWTGTTSLAQSLNGFKAGKASVAVTAFDLTDGSNLTVDGTVNLSK